MASGEARGVSGRLRSRGGMAALGVLVAVCVSAARATADPAATARAAARHCAAGELDTAARELRALRVALETELGEGHDAAWLVRLRLAEVERARGNPGTAKALEAAPAGEARETRVDPDLERALVELRACAAPDAPPRPPPTTLSVDDHLLAARRFAARGRYREAREAADRAYAAAAGSPRPRERMQASEGLALMRLQLGEAEAALRAADEARALAKQLGDAQVRIAMARLVAQAGDLEGARSELEAVAEVAKGDPERADLEEARGELALRLGSPSRAHLHLERAREGHEKHYGADHASTAGVWHLLGEAHRLAGDFAAAAEAYGRALQIRRAVFGDRHAETARTRNALGVLHADFGDWKAADRAFALALEALEAGLGAEHPETLTVKANRALAAWAAGRGDAAADRVRRAVAGLSRVLGEAHPEVATARRNLARIEFEAGHAERADAILDSVLRTQVTALGEAHPAVATTRLMRARLLARRGAFAAARDELERTRTHVREALGEEHPLTARVRTLLARVAVALGEDGLARSEARAALHALELHVRRAFEAMSERERGQIVAWAYDAGGALLSARGGEPRDTYLALLPHRDAVLRSIAAGRAAARRRGRALDRRLAEIAELRERYVASVLGVRAGTASQLHELASRIDRLESDAQREGSLRLREPRKVLERVCKALPRDGALIETVSYDRAPRANAATEAGAYTAFVITGRGCRVQRVALGPGTEIDAASQRFGAAMLEQKTDASEARTALARHVIAPLLPALEGVRRWLVVPDGDLWGVPFGSLPDPERPDRYLLERVTLGYLTSAHELADTGKRPRLKLDDTLLLGAPAFGGGRGAGPIVLTTAGPCTLPPFEPLPATRIEVEEIGGLIGEPRLLLGDGATKNGLQRALAAHPQVIHLATHAYFAGASGCAREGGSVGAWRGEEAVLAPNPLLLSGIVLAGANAPGLLDGEQETGILTAYEVAGLDLRDARLVVLSACETGTGIRQRGQEVKGLRWGFRAAGARALVTSLWRSNDVATRGLMRAFYSALTAGDLAEDVFRGAEALRRAQLERVATDRRLNTHRPLLWANFVFSGVL